MRQSLCPPRKGYQFPWLQAVAVTFCALGPSAAMPQVEHHLTYEDALTMVQHGRGGASVEVIQKFAEQDDARAQTLLGAVLIEGKLVPADRVQGYKWLVTSVQGYRGTLHWKANLPAANALLTKAATALSGAEILKGEQLAQQFCLDRNQDWGKTFLLGARDLLSGRVQASVGDEVTTETMSHGRPLRIVGGCALNPKLSGCSRYSTQEFETAHCTEMPETTPDAWPSTTPKTSAITPASGPYPWLEGTVAYTAIVDRTGFICFAALTDSTGVGDLDKSLLETISRWKLAPAIKNGEAVASWFNAMVTLKWEPIAPTGQRPPSR